MRPNSLARRRFARSSLFRPQLRFEPLEDRSLLSTIIWTNRDDTFDDPGDPDDVDNKFDDVFCDPNFLCDDYSLARDVVDAAIAHWQRVINDFNYSDGTNTYEIEIHMNPDAPDTGASATPLTYDSNGSPRTGTIDIGSGGDGPDPDTQGDGINLFLDSTPHDSVEFTGTYLNAFIAKSAPFIPAADLYSTVLHELGHVLGISFNSPLFLSKLRNTGASASGVSCGREGDQAWLFDGATVDVLMHGTNVRETVAHPLAPFGARGQDNTWPGHESITFEGKNLFGSWDVMNPCGAGGGWRGLISNSTALMLKDTYGYDITMPETFGSFYSILDEDTGELLVRGGRDNTQINNVDQGPSDDVIFLRQSGNQLIVTIDIGDDIPGTGPTDDFVSVYDLGQVTSITIDAGGGDDLVSLTSTTLDQEVTVIGGGGANDRLVIVDVTLFGETPEYWVFDNFVSPPSGIGITYQDFDALSITDGAGSARFRVFGTPAGTTLELTGGSGDDQFDLGEGFSLFEPDTLEHLEGDFVDIHGGLGVNTLWLYDNDHADDTAYSITELAVAKFLSFVANYDGINSIELNGGSGDNPYILRSSNSTTTLTTPVTINAGSGSDRFEIGFDTDPRANLAGIQTTIDIHEGLGADTLILHNESAAAACDFTVLENGVLRPGIPALPFVLYDAMENLRINTGSVADTLRAIRTPPGMLLVDVNSGGGGDQIELGSTSFVPRALSAIGALVNLDGGAGSDHVTLIDVGNTTGATYTIDSEAVLRSDGTRLLDYEDLQLMTVSGGSGPDTLTVESTLPDMPVFLNAGAGDDTINIGSPVANQGRLSLVRSRVAIDGQAGNDRVLLFDTANTQPAQYSIGSDEFRRQDSTRLMDHEDVSFVAFTAGSGNDQIAVTSTFAAPISIAGGGGDDRIDVGSNGLVAGRLSQIVSPVSVDGGPGADQLLLHDQANTSPAQYTITNEEVKNAGGGQIADYEDIISLHLFAGSGGNVFTVESSFGASVNIDMGRASDTIHVGSQTPSQRLLAPIVSNISVDGGGGTDTAIFHDEDNTTAAQYSFTPSVRRTGGASLFSDLDGLEGLVFNAGSGSDTITIERAIAPVPVTINAGNGNDQLHVGAGTLNSIQAAVRIEGQGNSDTLTIHDEAFDNHGTYTVSSAAVTRLLTPGSVSYGTIEGIVLNAGPLDDLISVPNLLPGATAIIHGGAGNDSIDASLLNVPVQLFGDEGNDVLTSGGGNDELHGGPGDDQLTAGGGEENELSDGSGSDQLTGGSGSDSYFLSLGGADVVTDPGGIIHALNFAPGLGGVSIDLDVLNAAQPVRGAETLRLNQPVESVSGTDAGDVFFVRPLSFARTVNGNDPTSAPGDTLNFNPLGLPPTVTGTTITVAGFAPLSYFGIETLTGVSRSGDANGDGAVDCTDAALLTSNFGRTSGASVQHGNFDTDGDVDVADLAILQSAITCQRPGPSAPSASATANVALARRPQPTRLSTDHRRRLDPDQRPVAAAVDQVLSAERQTATLSKLRARRAAGVHRDTTIIAF
jgi:Ca2+-binding RTX toxin-like protein